jgi:hypothetical protein
MAERVSKTGGSQAVERCIPMNLLDFFDIQASHAFYACGCEMVSESVTTCQPRGRRAQKTPDFPRRRVTRAC